MENSDKLFQGVPGPTLGQVLDLIYRYLT